MAISIIATSSTGQCCSREVLALFDVTLLGIMGCDWDTFLSEINQLSLGSPVWTEWEKIPQGGFSVSLNLILPLQVLEAHSFGRWVSKASGSCPGYGAHQVSRLLPRLTAVSRDV